MVDWFIKRPRRYTADTEDKERDVALPSENTRTMRRAGEYRDKLHTKERDRLSNMFLPSLLSSAFRKLRRDGHSRNSRSCRFLQFQVRPRQPRRKERYIWVLLAHVDFYFFGFWSIETLEF